MSATDKEQHTDTEKATEKTESDRSRSCNSVNNVLEPDSSVPAEQPVDPVPVTEEPAGGGATDRGNSVGTSSDSTPPTTIEESHVSQSLYFQNMFRTYAGNLEMFREGNRDSGTFLRSHPLIPDLESESQNSAIFHSQRLPEPASGGSNADPDISTNTAGVTNRPPCTCGAVAAGSNRHSCYSHPDQHVRDDLLLRSASFDTSAASISSVATIPDSVAYELSCGSADEAVDIMSSDDHRSVYSPTGLSFDGASDYYSSDPECSAGAMGRARGEVGPGGRSGHRMSSSYVVTTSHQVQHQGPMGEFNIDAEFGTTFVSQKGNIGNNPNTTAATNVLLSYAFDSNSQFVSANSTPLQFSNPHQQNQLQQNSPQQAVIPKIIPRRSNFPPRNPHTEQNPTPQIRQQNLPERPLPLARSVSPRVSPRSKPSAGSRVNSNNRDSGSDVFLLPNTSRQNLPPLEANTTQNHPLFTAGDTNQTAPFIGQCPISAKSNVVQPENFTPEQLLLSYSRRSSDVFVDNSVMEGVTVKGNINSDVFESEQRRSVACPVFDYHHRDSTGTGSSSSVIQEPKNLYSRLMQSYTVWYLPNLTRQDAIEYLQNRQPGNFIVRHSSQPGTMALSLRSTRDCSEESLVEHFQIINTAQGLQINEAQNSFVDIVSLLQYYYENNNNGLPCQLRLPRSIEKATGFELNQYWIMGEQFWIRSMNGELTDSGGSNSDEFTSDPADRATLERTIRTTSYNDDTESTARDSPPSQFEDTRPPVVPPKPDEIKQLIQIECRTNPDNGNFMSSERIRKGAKDFFAKNSNLEHQISVSVSNDASISRRPPALFTDSFVGAGTEFNVHSPTGSVFQNSKTTPSDSGYDTSSKNVFEMNMQSNNVQHPQMRNNACYLHQSSSNSPPPLTSVRSDPMLQPGDPFSVSCPASAFSRSDSNATEHTSGCGGSGAHLTTQFNPSSTNPFTFPTTEANSELLSGVLSDNCSPSNSSSKHRGSNRDSLNVKGCSNMLMYHQPTQSYGAGGVSSSKICNSQAFSDDTSLSSDRDPQNVLSFSTNNPFYNYVLQTPPNMSDNSAKAALDNPGQIIKSNWSTDGSSAGQPSQKFNSNENFQKSTTAPVSASSCESVHSANQSERSSTSSIFFSKKVLIGLYDKGRNKFYQPPASGMSPSTFGNWIPPNSDNFDYNTAFYPHNMQSSKSSTLPLRPKISKKFVDNDSLEEHDDTKFPRGNGNDPSMLARRNVTATWKVPKVPRFWLNLRRKGKNPPNKIRTCIVELAQDPTTNLYQRVNSLIEKYSKETAPTSEILTQVRKEMNALKIYLTSPNEQSLSDLIDRERAKMRENDFLNMDSITEDALHKIVLKPLHKPLMTALINLHKSNGSLDKMEANLIAAKLKSPKELGIPERLQPPDGKQLETVKYYFKRMHCSFSPTAKLEHLLAASKAIYIAVECSGTLKVTSPCSGSSAMGSSSHNSSNLGAEEFLPMLIYCLAHYKFSTVEIEAEYIWKLLPSHIARSEAGYYLTALSVAAHILKNMPENGTLTPSSPVTTTTTETTTSPSPPTTNIQQQQIHSCHTLQGSDTLSSPDASRRDDLGGGMRPGSGGGFNKGGHLSPQDTPSQHMRGGSPIAMGSGRSGGNTPASLSALNTTSIKPGTGSLLHSPVGGSDGTTTTTHQQLPCLADWEGCLKVVFPDEKTETIITKSLPVPPSLSAADVCAMVANKLKISHNPEEFGLYVVVDGEPSKINDEECPQQVKAKLVAENRRHLFAYQRHTAIILWAKTTSNSPPSTLNTTTNTSTPTTISNNNTGVANNSTVSPPPPQQQLEQSSSQQKQSLEGKRHNTKQLQTSTSRVPFTGPLGKEFTVASNTVDKHNNPSTNNRNNITTSSTQKQQHKMSFTNEALSLQSSNFVALPPQQTGGGGGNPILRFPFRAPGKMPSTAGPSKSFSAGRSRGGGSLSPQPRQAVDNQYVTSTGDSSLQQRGGGYSVGQHFRTAHESGDHLSLSLPHNARHTTLSSPEPLGESVRRSFTPEKSGGKSDLPVTPRS